MERLVQCPVCTLFLHRGMALEVHLDTHPKDQVIRALCSLSGARPRSEPEEKEREPESPGAPSPSSSSFSSDWGAREQRRAPLHLAFPAFLAPTEPSAGALPAPFAFPTGTSCDGKFSSPGRVFATLPSASFRPDLQLRPVLQSPPVRPTVQATIEPRPTPRPPPLPRQVNSDAPTEPAALRPEAAGEPATGSRLPRPLPSSNSSGGLAGGTFGGVSFRAKAPATTPPVPSPTAHVYDADVPSREASPRARAEVGESGGRLRGFKILSDVKIERPMRRAPPSDGRRKRPGPASSSDVDVEADADADADVEDAVPPDSGPPIEAPPRPPSPSPPPSPDFRPTGVFSVIKNVGRLPPMAPETPRPPEHPAKRRSPLPAGRGPKPKKLAVKYLKPKIEPPDCPEELPPDVDEDCKPSIARVVQFETELGLRRAFEDPGASRPEAVRPGNVIAFGGPASPAASAASAEGSRFAFSPTRALLERDSPPPPPPPLPPPPLPSIASSIGKIEFRSDEIYYSSRRVAAFTFDPGAYAPTARDAPAQPVGFKVEDPKESFFDASGSSGVPAKEEEAINIRTDERMPPRGELSEQESSGDTDAPWAGMYRDMGGSTSYDLLARESWQSDGSDAEAPLSPQKLAIHENEVEDIPIVVSVKPPDKNYKCATCGKAFNCPKERRVHRTKEHPIGASNIMLERKIRRKQVLLKTNIKIKKERTVKTECVVTTSSVNILRIENENVSARLDIEPVVSDLKNLEILNNLENKPKLELVKVEGKKKRQDYTCVTCKAEFPSDNLFHEHLKIHPLECLTCGKLFNRRSNLQLHIKRHLGIKNFKCDICEKRFVTKQKLVEHYNIHTGKSPIKCNLCDLTFRRHSNMTQHRNRHHFHIKRRLRDYVCICGEVFHSKKKLAWHKEIHDDKPKACLHCNEKFIHTASLTRHMRRTHNRYFVPDEKRKSENVQCPECNHIYLKSSIDMHMKTHTGMKPYSCVICNKNFTTKWNLKLHKWTHANRSSKPFKCALCKGAFIRHTDYVSHMNSHKSVRPYTCNHCGCQFIRKYNCQRHVKEHENEKKYVCEVPDCGKTFHRSYYLTDHLKVHSGIRPYSCNICGKTSSTKSNHNKHVKIHHAREPVTTEG